MTEEKEQTEEILFKDLGLNPEIQQAIDEIGFDKPSPIQAEAIPELLTGHDVIGQARGHAVAIALEVHQARRGDPRRLLHVAVEGPRAGHEPGARLGGGHLTGCL